MTCHGTSTTTQLPWKKCEWIESAIGDIVSTQEETEFSISKVFLFLKKVQKENLLSWNPRDEVRDFLKNFEYWSEFESKIWAVSRVF